MRPASGRAPAQKPALAGSEHRLVHTLSAPYGNSGFSGAIERAAT